MRIVNTNQLEELAWASPKGRYRGFGKEVSEALGREPSSTDLDRRHPFDVEILSSTSSPTTHAASRRSFPTRESGP
jgi:hypothetical protein